MLHASMAAMTRNETRSAGSRPTPTAAVTVGTLPMSDALAYVEKVEHCARVAHTVPGRICLLVARL